jgi:RNA polymerase sigma-70 factor (ECF subfamily)
MAVPEEEISDIVQDAYVQIAQLDSVSHIRNARAYLFTVARSVVLQRVRRDRIVRIDAMTEMQALTLVDDNPDAERRVSARMELARIRSIIETLPEPCREIFQLRRIEGLSQREIAQRLEISEDRVETYSQRGLTLVLRVLAAQGIEPLFNKTPRTKRSDSRNG